MLLAVLGGSAASPSAQAAYGASSIVFPKADAFRTPVPRDPRVDSESSRMTLLLGRPAAPATLNLHQFATPVYWATSSTPRHRLRVIHEGTGYGNWGRNTLSSDLVPIPDDARPSPGSDGKIVVVDRANDRVFDLWRAAFVNGSWQADWGGVYPLDGDGSSHRASYGSGPHQVPWAQPVSRGTGSGISSLAGIITIDELAAGVIPHALVFATDDVCGPAQSARYRWPATTTDGAKVTGNCLPEGARVQLDPAVDLDRVVGLSRVDRMIGKALQRYGAYCTDRGGTSMAITTEAARSASDRDVLRGLGLTGDYHGLRLPDRFRVLATWNGS